jgi:hypothetical protein
MSTSTETEIDVDTSLTVPCQVELCSPTFECDAPATHRVRIVHDHVEVTCVTVMLCTAHAQRFVAEWARAELVAAVIGRAFGCKAHTVPCHVHADPL